MYRHSTHPFQAPGSFFTTTSFGMYAVDANGEEYELVSGNGSFSADSAELGKSAIPHQLLLKQKLIHPSGLLVIRCKFSHRADFDLPFALRRRVPYENDTDSIEWLDGDTRTEANASPDPVQPAPEHHQLPRLLELGPSTETDLAEWKSLLSRPEEIAARTDELYNQLFSPLPDGTVRLQITFQYQPRLLLVEGEEDGLVRGFCRISAASNCFRCTMCDVNKTKEEERRRVTARVEANGEIHVTGVSGAEWCPALTYNPSPSFQTPHLARCRGKTKEQVIIQQLRRRIIRWERETTYGISVHRGGGKRRISTAVYTGKRQSTTTDTDGQEALDPANISLL